MPYIDGLPIAPTVSSNDLVVVCQGSDGLAGTGIDRAAPVSLLQGSLAGVASFNTRTGTVILSSADVTTALGFTPYSNANPSNYQSGTQVATAVGVETARAQAAEALLAPLASPTLTGTPRGPTSASTAAAGTTQLATQAFVRNGTTTSDNAFAGQVGEFISSTVLSGASIGLTTATPANVTVINLTAGDWDVYGTIDFNPAGTTTITAIAAAINTTSATFPTAPGAGAYQGFTASFSTGFPQFLFAGQTRISLAAPANVYLVAQASFGTSTMRAYGFIGARRAR